MTRVEASAVLRPALVGTLFLSVWLFLAAMPVLADGGPHVAGANSGNTSLTADGCAGCHRAHTAQGGFLLAEGDEEDLCLSCHGAAGTGATTNVEDGVQYALANDGDGQPVAGALRSGGFVNARIDSTNPSRISYPRLFFGTYVTFFSSHVPVRADGAPVSSAHLAFDGTGVVATNTAWGNGATNSGPGPVTSIGCGSCHNPHGNGQYRILNPIPGDGDGAIVEVGSGIPVTDAPLPVGADDAGTRNYTVLWGRTLADVNDGTYPGGGTGPAGGDYWRRYLPWDGVPGWNGSSATPASGVAGDRPMYVPGGSNLNSFRTQITFWCSACHTRHDEITGATFDTGDAIYRYRHDIGQNECTQCHVAHGSNAPMPGAYSATYPYPDGAASGSSRLLKIDNRGTCQACHDPTHTIPFTNVIN